MYGKTRLTTSAGSSSPGTSTAPTSRTQTRSAAYGARWVPMARADGKRNGHERSQPALRSRMSGSRPGYGQAPVQRWAGVRASHFHQQGRPAGGLGRHLKPLRTGDTPPPGADGGSRVLGALPLEDQLVVLGGAERGHAGSEDLHEPPAVPRMLVHRVLVGVPGFVADAEERRAPVFSEPNKLVLIAQTHGYPFPWFDPRLMIDLNRRT